MNPTLAMEKLWAALEAGPAQEWKDAREPNGRGMGWSAGPNAWLGADSYSKETAASAALIAACSPLTIQALLDELEACKVDAERYRWLREQIQSGPFTIAKSDSWALQPWSGDDPDARIDAARAALTKE